MVAFLPMIFRSLFWVLTLGGAAADIWGVFGGRPKSVPQISDADITAGLTPAVASVGGVTQPVIYVQVPPATAGAQPAQTKTPTTKEIVNTAVSKPSSLFGIAAVGFVAVFVISQIRAGFHEATETTKDLYNEGGRAVNSLANADAKTGNISRRARK